VQSDNSFEGGELPHDVEEALRLQDEALELLQRLRELEPFVLPKAPHLGGGRRDFRRWPAPRDVTIEFHDGKSWQPVACGDLGIGGARLAHLPNWVKGPVPARLNAPGLGSPVILLSDVMWREGSNGKAGIRFEFQDEEEREYWSGALIDALLAEHALQ